MPLDQENDAPVASEELQTEPVEQTQEPTLAEGEKPSEPEETQTEKPNGYQKRIDRLTREKHQLRAELEAVRQRDSAGAETVALDRSQFSSEDEYLDAVLDYRENQREVVKAERHWHEKREQILGDAEDSGVDLDAFSKLGGAITKTVAEAIVESDAPVDLIAYLTENPKEARRIATLSPSRQAAEIGKIEATLGGDKPRVAAKTAAPTPIKPLSGSGKSSTGYRADMSTAEYAKWRGRKF